MTKEEICKKQTNSRPMPMKDIYAAMDEYVKQQAIAFAEWLRENEFTPKDKSGVHTWIQLGSKIGWLQPGKSIIKTSDQLFTLFLNDIK